MEREFGRLTNEWALSPLRVRGLDRVRLHADLTIFAKLACALNGTRAVPVAAWSLSLLLVAVASDEEQRRRTQCDAVAGGNLYLHDAPPAEPGSIRGAEVGEHEAFGRTRYVSMASRHALVADH